jgi:hypothetical protein
VRCGERRGSRVDQAMRGRRMHARPVQVWQGRPQRNESRPFVVIVPYNIRTIEKDKGKMRALPLLMVAIVDVARFEIVAFVEERRNPGEEKFS